MIKTIYIAKRKPGFSKDEFVRRWRMHGALGMGGPIWPYALAYTQAETIDPIDSLDGTSAAAVGSEYDGVAYLMLQDGAFDEPKLRDPNAGPDMRADELETFSGPIWQTSLQVSPEELKHGAMGGVTAFLYFLDPDKARTAAEDCQVLPEVNRVTLNIREASIMRESTLPYQAIVEVSATDRELLTRAAASAAQSFRSADLAVTTREALQWDRLSN